MRSDVEFQNGQKMPIVGLGMWQTTDDAELETAVDEALKIGYRHFDTAYLYANEQIFGRVLKKWFDSGKIKRDELFITTKLPCNGMHKDRVELFLNKSLSALQLDYVDLYLIHMPFGTECVDEKVVFPMKDGKLVLDKTTDLEAIWKAMEVQADAGKAKSIGISNFNAKQIERILKIARIHPQNLQVEVNVQFQQRKLRELCKKHNIIVTAYGPLGSPGTKALLDKLGVSRELPKILSNPTVLKVAEKYKKSAGQILLRFLAQQDIVVIPKSVKANRLKENFEIFDFELIAEDMTELEGLDKGDGGRFTTFDMFNGIVDHPEYPF